MQKFDYVAITHPGLIREKNEDNYYVNGAYRPETQDGFKSVGSCEKECIVAVCDGMGGCANGQRASAIAVNLLKEYEDNIRLGFSPRLFQDPMNYIQRANQSICDEIKKTGTAMGTTVSFLEFFDGEVVAGNLGDSSIFLYRKGEFQKLSTDHTVIARMIRMNQITELEAKTHPMAHQLTQYLGILPEEMILEPAMTVPMSIKAGDRYLICSDGLTDMLEEIQIVDILDNKCSLEESASALVDAALQYGGKDNITVVLVEVQGKRGIWEWITR